MRMLISFAALFLSVALLQLSSGGVGPLDALTGLELGFSQSQVGFLGSAHFVGFFIGCWFAPRLLGSVGHSRAFAAFTAAGSIGLIAHMMVIDPYALPAKGGGSTATFCVVRHPATKLLSEFKMNYLLVRRRCRTLLYL